MDINSLCNKLDQHPVEHAVDEPLGLDGVVIHRFSRNLPMVATGGTAVFGQIRLELGQTEVPRREIEALLRRLWILQVSEEWFGNDNALN